MASVTQLGYLGIGVSKPEEWERFATEVLGLQANGKDPDGALYLRMDEYHHRFIILPGGADDLAFTGWEVPDHKALLEIADRLATSGLKVSKGTPEEARARRVVDLIRLADPSGIPTEIYYGPLMSFESAFKPPRSVSGFVTGDMGMGHIVIRADDNAKSLHFYRDLLGLRISDYIDLKMRGGSADSLTLTFMHCNPRHHSIAFGEIPVRKRLMHFMLEARSVDDVGQTMYLCQDRNIPISGTLGRHTNDHMMSFYMRTPSGFEVEYGWGGRRVDDATWQVQKHEAGSIWGHRGPQPPPPERKPSNP